MLELMSVSKMFSDKKLFENVNLKFNGDNCYGVIGANGAGKSTLLKIITGTMPASSGQVKLGKDERMGVLGQDHNAFNDKSVLETVLSGFKELSALKEEIDSIYANPEATDDDYMKAGDLSAKFEEMGGWEAESNATKLLTGLGLEADIAEKDMKDLKSYEKVKVLLAQAMFGTPEYLILDEPTNHLDMKAIAWLENYLYEYPKTVIVVSHDVDFLNKVCTHIVDVDFGEAKLYPGNYDFWKQSSELARDMQSKTNSRKEDQIKQLQDFIARFGANASKAKQATSRKKLLDKITLDDIKPSSRKYPFIGMELCRDIGKDALEVKDLTFEFEGKKIIDNVSFILDNQDKVAIIGSDDIAKTKFLEILIGKETNFTGEFKWGQTVTPDIFENDNSKYFLADSVKDMNMIQWLAQYDDEKTESELRGFLGRMLFTGDSPLKKVSVCSGGEKVRLMFSRLMLSKSNALLLDQPLDHLDLESIESVIDGLEKYKGILIYTTHNKTLVNKTATMIIDLDTMTVTRDSLDEYINKK